jgi:hypothetical protein
LILVCSITLGSQKEAEFKRHVEPGKRWVAIDLCPRNDHECQTGILNDGLDLASRFSDESSASSAQRGTNPERKVVNTIAQKKGL